METAQKQKRKRKSRQKPVLSFCQRLVQNLNRPSHRLRRPLVQTSQIVKSPTELRQLVLEHVLTDDLLPTADLSLEAKRLALVCRIFRDDMKWVSATWRQRKEQLTVLHTGAFKSYIADLMAPLMAASRSRAITQSTLKQRPAWLAEDIAFKHKEKKRSAILQGHQDSLKGPYSRTRGNLTILNRPGSAALSAEERADAQQWQALRIGKVEEMLSTKKDAKDWEKQLKKQAMMEKSELRREKRQAKTKSQKKLKRQQYCSDGVVQRLPWLNGGNDTGTRQQGVGERLEAFLVVKE